MIGQLIIYIRVLCAYEQKNALFFLSLSLSHSHSHSHSLSFPSFLSLFPFALPSLSLPSLSLPYLPCAAGSEAAGQLSLHGDR